MSGRVVLVTGAARGIGASTVRRLVERGDRVLAVDSCQGDAADVPYRLASRDDLDQLAVACGDAVLAHVADVRDRAGLQAAVDLALDRWGRLDAAVAAAAVIAGGRPLWETPEADLDLLWDVDVRGVWNTAAVTVPAFLVGPDPQGARFVAVASAAASHGLFGLAAYNAAKHAVVGVVKGLAADLVGSGVTACAVSPGSTRTPMLTATAELYDMRAVDDFAGNQLLRRLIDPDEVAATIAFCCSRESGHPERLGRPSRRRILVVTTTMAADQLPNGFEVQLKDDLIRADGGRVLVGGSPARAVRLSGPAQALVSSGRVVVGDRSSAHLARRLLDGNLADPVLENIEVDASDLTVVVPVRDRADQLDRCLAALAPLRVVAVDDASADPEAIARVAERHGAHVRSLQKNLGPAGARNAGLALVTTPFVAFVDSDVVVDSGALLTLARHLTDPLVALVGPAVVGKPRNARPRWFDRYDAAAASLDLGRTGCQVRPGAAVAWLPSACLVGRVDRLGSGFNSAMRVGEDVDLVWRLGAAGSLVRYDPSVTASHDVRPTVRAWLGRKFVYGTGGADLAERHGDKVAPAALSLTSAVGAAAILQRRWWSMPFAAVAVATTTRKLAPRLPIERGRTMLATRLSTRGLGWAVRQETGLLLRHWWPATAMVAPFSRSVRRALVTAVVLDLALFLRERRPGVDPATALFARRLDDLAYGAGLWWGAIRRRSTRCLKVRRSHPTG